MQIMNGFPTNLKPVNDPRRDEIDLAALFGPAEHGLYGYYGRLGQGKTYAMTADIIADLKKGAVWYVNYPIYWNGYDERENKMQLFLGALGIRKKYYQFLDENLHYLPVDENFHDVVQTLTDCKIGLDEGYVAYDSYEMAKLTMAKRQTIFHARHYDRSFYYTVQRPTSIHTTLRSQTNVFYKVTRFNIPIFNLVLFRRQEFDLGPNEQVDETNTLSTKWYVGKREIFEAYDTKYLRGSIEPSQITHVKVHRLSWWETIMRLTGRFTGEEALERPAPVVPTYIETARINIPGHIAIKNIKKHWDIIRPINTPEDL